MATSPDGGTFTPVAVTPDVYYGLAFNGSYYVSAAQSAIYTSSDASTWTSRVAANGVAFKSVAWTDTQFMAVGQQGKIAIAGANPANSMNWIGTNVGSYDFNSIAYHSPLSVIVGNGGVIQNYNAGYTARSSGTGENLYGVAWVGGLWVAVGAKNTILTSPDGVTWTVRPLFP